MGKTIKNDYLSKHDNEILKNKNYNVIQSALSQVQIEDIMSKPSEINKLPFVFNYQLKEKVRPTNQYYSGRCWIFSALNIFRHHLIEHYKLPPQFELSEAFVFKYDRIEKCNYLLELMYEFAKKDNLHSLEFASLISNINSDGGTIDQFINIINKYGIVPKSVFPDNIQVKDTNMLDDLLCTLIKKASINITKKMSQVQFSTYKQTILDEFYRLLTLTLGSIPDTFDWTYKDSVLPTNYTPLTYYNKVVKPLVNIDDYIVISNDERNEYNKLLAVEYLNNMVKDSKDSKEFKRTISNLYLNVDINTMKKSVFKTFTKYKTPVWVATDWNYFVLNDETILDHNSSTIQDIFDIDIIKNKKVLLNARITQPAHALVILGCQKENKKFLRWKAENSHGTKNEFDGFVVMSDEFFNNYMLIALVHKNTLSPELRHMYKERKSENIKWLPFWDIFGYSAD
jgi:bleomycin hydrolase